MQRRELHTPEVPLDSTARQRIIAAAREQFLAHGFRSVTMDDLAEGLGMSKKTVYAHFPSKSALLEAMLLDKFRCAEEELEAITSEFAADFPSGLHRLLACVQRHTEEVRPPFLRDIQREAPDLFKVVQARRREVIQRYFSKLLGEGRREGLIRKDTPVHLLIEILLGAVEAIINPARLAELGLSPKSGFTVIISVILEGALTPEGRRSYDRLGGDNPISSLERTREAGYWS
jgi:AcrR family transcriptional regulator